MQRVPRRSVRPFGSPQRINAVLDEELAEHAGEQIRLSERGHAWYARYNITLPAIPRDIETVDQAPLPPIDYAPLGALPVPEESGSGPRPPAPAPLRDDWHKAGRRTKKEIEKTYAMAAEAAARAAQSTARDVADLTAGPDRKYWTNQYPLAQYDENAAAALETLTDPVAHEYAARAVLNLRAALEEAGKEAADHYVSNVRNPQWKTAKGVQADDVHRVRVRGIVITYLDAVRDHATKYGLDADTIVNVLEDAAGWAGELVPLGNKQVKSPQLPAAEHVAEAAQHVANELRAYALGETDTVDTVADRRANWRVLEPRPTPSPPTSEAPGPVPGTATRIEAEMQPVPAASEQVRSSAGPPAPAPDVAEDSGPLEPSAEGPREAAAQPTPPTRNGTSSSEAAATPPAADTSTGSPQHTRQRQGVREQPAREEQALPPLAPTGTDNAEPAAASEAETAVAQAPDTQAPLTTASSTATPAGRAADSTQGPWRAATLPPEITPMASEADEEPPGADPGASAEQAVDEADDRAQSTAPEVGSSLHHQPAAARQEGTVATSAPTNSSAAEQPLAPDPNAGTETAAPYPDTAAYTAAHQALLRELDQHEQWLSDTPAASRAATPLTDTDTLGVPGLTDLLALQAVLAADTDDTGERAQLARQLGHHIQSAQLTLAKIFHGQAARTTDTEKLRELHRTAVQGQFIAFLQQTENGEMELGQYIQHRAQQVTPQPVGPPDSTEPTPETAQEPTTMAVDPDDDIQLPVFELPGEVLMTAEEAAPRLLAQAQAYMASGAAEVALLAHIHGRPVYALVDHEAEAPVLWLGLTAVDEEGSARAVTLPPVDLDAVDAQTLLAAVTAWMNANDGGARPVLDYSPTASAPAPSQPAPAEAPQAAPGPATPAPPAAEPDTAQEAAVPPAPAAPESVPVTGEAEHRGADSPVAQPAAASPAAADQEAVTEPAASPREAASTASEGGAEGRPSKGQEQQDDAGKAEPAAAPAEQPGPAPADPVDQLTALARAALTDLGVTLEATGVLTADRTVVITLETSGNADRDREIADRLRPVLHEAIRQHPEKSLAAYRIDFQHTPQVGQGALSDAPGAQISVPRERLIDANRAAAQIFAERLRSDPNAELSRTYLTGDRQLPAEVQQEWGLGYAPSDRSAGRWDLLTRELMAQGFSEDELLHAGLATTSKRGTLIDAFSDRIMFPIHDENQDIVGFSGRRVDRPGETKEQAEKRGGPKYFNTSSDADLFNKSELVFGLHHPAQAGSLASSSGPRVSVEGPLDVIAVARAAATLPLAQRPVVGAPMGTAFTARQLTALRGLDTEQPRPHIAFLDADESGRKVLLDKWDLLLKADGPTTVTTAPDAKDAAKLWEEGIQADGDGATPVLRALEQHQPLLDAAVEAVLVGHADEGERANHAFDSNTFFPRTRFVAAEAARYIHQWVQAHAPGDTAALEHAALTWAKKLHQEWSIPGYMTATAVLLGPGNHDQDYENEVYEQALDLLAADPEGYFANDSHVRSRQSAAEATSVPTAAPSPDGTGPQAPRPGQWPAGTRASGPLAATSPQTDEPAPGRQPLTLSMILPSPVEGRPEVEYTDRTTAAYALHAAVHERLGQHTIESPEPDRLPQPLKLGTVYGVDLSTSGDDQTSDDPTVVVWLGTARSDSLRMSYSRFVEMSGPELLAAIEWRAAQAAGLLGTPLSQTWRAAVRSILPAAFPAKPTPAQLADLLDTIAQGPDGSEEYTRRRAEQALSAYTAGHPDLALDVLAADDHIWVVRNDGSWTQEEAAQQTWEELDNGFSQEAAELDDITRAAAELPSADETPMAADLTVAHHSAHEALAALRPYSIGLPGTLYEKITDLVAQMDAGEPALRRLHGPGGEQLMNRAKRCVVRILEGLATVASKIRLTSLGNRLERAVARLRGQDPDEQTVPRAVRTDRRMQDLAHIERDLERRMASPTTTLAERGELQEQWIINRARWRARFEQLNGQPPGGDFLPDNGLVAGAPPVPNLIAAHEMLLDRLAVRVAELRDTDPHTGEDANPYEPTADLLNGVAWAYQQRLIGIVPTGDDPQGPIPPAQLRQAALTVTAHQNASPLTLRRTMNVTAERADRLLHRLEEQQILGPYRADAPRTVLARATDIDSLLARPATPTGPRTPPVATDRPPTTKSPAPTAADAPEEDVDDLVMARLRELVSKIIADKETRSVTGGEPEPADGTAPASRVRKNLRKTTHQEAADNALAAGQSPSFAPSQS
ncbi:toprim domain-containing protein [Streptomyces ardesiacus]|uniref:toprim domain-containing protein n=1 Tax=Streptomyces ardesiacus TaxID=285564 RepID=UPI00364C8407